MRLISYLAPSLPEAFFELVAGVIADGTGMDVDLRFETRISGPLPGDENPFLDGTADVGFVCSPTYRWLKQELSLLPVPVPVDERARGRPVYFGDVVIHRDSAIAQFSGLRGRRWAFNDPNSRSGWFAMLDRIAPRTPQEYFSEIVNAGSHLESLRLVGCGEADAASIDSNTLLREFGRSAVELRVLESWGPFPIQPVVIRNDVPPPLSDAIRRALLRAHESLGPQLRSLGFLRFVEPDPTVYTVGP